MFAVICREQCSGRADTVCIAIEDVVGHMPMARLHAVLPRDAVLARYLLWTRVCLVVCQKSEFY